MRAPRPAPPPAAPQQEIQTASAAVEAATRAGEVEWEEVQVGRARVGEPGVTTYVQGELVVDEE